MAGRMPAPDRDAADVDNAVRDEARFGVAFLKRHGGRLALVFAGLLLPMWGFAELADDIHEREVIGFDAPLLAFAHSLASAGADRFFTVVTKLGYGYGVVPADILLVLVLTWLRRFREATFAAIALGGSGLLNMATKLAFARERPALWDSVMHESTYSFPSGHAMGSATLACVAILLAWRTRWRWPVLALALPFVLLVGFSRVYLGVHYPSDILAGWAAASVWTAASFLLVFRRRRQPWQDRAQSPAVV